MSPELDKKLVEKYPKLFINRNKSPQESCMHWGFECGDGWYWLIDKLCESIQSYIDNNSTKSRFKNPYVRKLFKILWEIKFNSFIRRHKILLKIRDRVLSFNTLHYLESRFKKEEIETIPQVKVDQVKEKFGDLRFYYSGGNKMIDGMVWLAVSMSYNICETCGSTTNVTQSRGSWITTLCSECHSK